MVEKNSDRWTQEEDDRLGRLLVADKPPSEIAETSGRTVSAVKARAYFLGIPLARFGIRRRGMSDGAVERRFVKLGSRRLSSLVTAVPHRN
jgi:hypothetical protein